MQAPTFTRDGWGKMEHLGDEGEGLHAYQTDGEHGIMGKDGAGWFVCNGSDGYVMDTARRYDTADEAAGAAESV